MMLPTVDGMKASILTADNEGIPSKKRSRVVVVEIIGYNGVDGHRMWTIDHHHIAYRVLYSSSMIITSLVYHKVTPCAIGRDDVQLAGVRTASYNLLE